ncbi:lipid asymmetry maintenance protein MlaB [Herbaspirillum sp. YR522]|uniref:STAS domain-containing protein n=1 Tax=Herbaspirillum sp. YR522 TaxID=1144342 RepID=UPI00026F6DFF|nr:STAS domain-containing protein [Herbaspirillum sp. YR522]EJN03356.1 putative NTP binding protein (contains STAS domain) [Herbaspirillum sp. YR522]
MFKPADSLTFKNASAVLRDGLAAIAGGQAGIDLSGVVVVDSSAVATLLAWRREAQKRGVALDFGILPANLQSLADLYGVSSLLYGTVSAPTSATDRHH